MVKIGDRIKIKSNVSHHTYIIGEIYEVVFINGFYITAKDKYGKYGNNISRDEFDIVYDNIDIVNKRLEELHKEKLRIHKMIDIMEKINKDDSLASELNAIMFVEEMDNKNLSRNEKIKRMMNIISNLWR